MKKIAFACLAALLAALLLCAAAEGAPGPSRPTCAALPTISNPNEVREAFFANGTPITIQEPKADTTGWVLDEKLQSALPNKFTEKKKPKQGAVISWQEGEQRRFVYVSGDCKVFGGSMNADVQADVQITVKGREVKKAFPNVSFLFGGGYNGNVIGSVTITLEKSQMMYVYGGGYNGSVTGDVHISSTEENWSLDMVGGGLASSMTGDAVADVGGNITMDLQGIMIGYMDSLVGGGLAESISSHTAQANVSGNITINADGRNVYQVCGGGEAFRTAADCGQPTACVGGSVCLNLRGSRVRFYADEHATLLGAVFAGGICHGGIATVGGDTEVTVADTLFDDDALGVVLGGMAEGDGADAGVTGSAVGRVLPGCNLTRLTRGGLVNENGSAAVQGNIDWYYTLRDGMKDY